MSPTTTTDKMQVDDSLPLELPVAKEDMATLYAAKTGPQGHRPHLASMEEYYTLYKESIQDPDAFWGRMARELLHWHRPFTRVLDGKLEEGNVSWFGDGQLNVCYNCVDRHALATPDKIALIWEADEPGQAQKVTYKQLLLEVSRLSNVLLSFGVRKGDTVAIYMPMVPEAAYAMLACSRIGAIHSVVFAGFSAEALRDRIQDASCSVLITADQGKRGSKTVHLKKIADEAVAECPSIQHVLLFRRTGDIEVPVHPGRDKWWHEEMLKQRPVCPPTPMHAEDPLFLLYTSGSTGKPKGVLHTTAGYLLGITSTLRYTFDLHGDKNDVFGCVADVGWITGHSYIVYGPLSNGATTLIFESVPTYPDAGRYWKMVEEHKITQFYTAPTAIRALKRLGDDFVNKYDLSSLRVIGSVGEPINPEAWKWYFQTVGKSKCTVVDTFWQTETGSFVIAPYSSITPTKPGSATLPQFGIQLELLDPHTGNPLEGKNQSGVLCIKKPWPSMARSVFNNHERYMETYMRPYPKHYFTGDGAFRDEDGYYWILGRVDDVLNVSGHRLSTAEIESALVHHPSCAEAAVVGVPDELTGQAIMAFCCLKPGSNETATTKELVVQIRKVIGPFATPKRIVVVSDLPKTRSGKIMRRILRKIAAHEVDQLGDLSTLADPSIIQILIEKVGAGQ